MGVRSRQVFGRRLLVVAAERTGCANGGAVGAEAKEMNGLGKNRTWAGVLDLPQNPDFSGFASSPSLPSYGEKWR